MEFSASLVYDTRNGIGKADRSSSLPIGRQVSLIIMEDITKKYSNGEVAILWKPSLCIHSGNCWRGLHEVFHPEVRPWITPEASTTEKIVAQVKKCPSGALSILDVEAE